MSTAGAIWFTVFGSVFACVGVVLAGNVKGVTSRFHRFFAQSEPIAARNGAGMPSLAAMRLLGAMCALAGIGVGMVGVLHI